MGKYQRHIFTTARYSKKIIRKKDFHTTFTGYEKEENLASEDHDMHESNKPEADAPAGKLATASRIKRKSTVSTPLQKWTETKKLLRNKVNNTQKAQKE